APWRQLLQRLPEALPIGKPEAGGADGDYRFVELGAFGPAAGKRRQRFAPFRQVPVRIVRQLRLEERPQRFTPLRETVRGKFIEQGSERQHPYLMATRDRKLKCCNSTPTCRKPAPARRLRWVSSRSGTSTFSSAARLRLISSSL